MVMKTLTAKELIDSGLLQEVNRQFFHPIGLAMYVETESNQMGIIDHRHDPEGIQFDDPSHDKYMAVARMVQDRMPDRVKALGFWIQPIKPKDNNETEHHPV